MSLPATAEAKLVTPKHMSEHTWQVFPNTFDKSFIYIQTLRTNCKYYSKSMYSKSKSVDVSIHTKKRNRNLNVCCETSSFQKALAEMTNSPDVDIFLQEDALHGWERWKKCLKAF